MSENVRDSGRVRREFDSDYKAVQDVNLEQMTVLGADPQVARPISDVGSRTEFQTCDLVVL